MATGFSPSSHHGLMVMRMTKEQSQSQNQSHNQRVLTMRPRDSARYRHHAQLCFNASSSGCDHKDSDFEALCRHGHIQEALPLLFLRVMDPRSSLLPPLFFTLFDSCSAKQVPREAKLVHACLLSYGLESFSFIAEGLVEILVKCGGFKDAIRIVYVLPNLTSNTWTILIVECIRCGKSHNALRMYRAMQEKESTRSVNPYNYVNMLKACADVGNLEMGKALHAEAWAQPQVKSNAFVGSSIISMYGSCGCIAEAKRVFDELPEQDVATWNAMLSAYIEQGQEEDALSMQLKMQNEGVSSNERTLVITLQACCVLVDKQSRDNSLQDQGPKDRILNIGRILHMDACIKGFESGVFLGNTLVNMYGKCRSIGEAEYVFGCSMPVRNVVSWTLMLSIYMEQHEENKVLHAYRQMREECVKPNEWTFSLVLQACSTIVDKEEACVVANRKIRAFALETVRGLHGDIRRIGLHSNVFLGSRLVHTYGKCGSIIEAENAFQGLHHPDAIAWSAMMAAYVEVSDEERALQLFSHICEKYFILDEQMFVIALQACCVLAEGKSIEAHYCTGAKDLALQIGESIHVDVVKKGLDVDAFVSRAICNMYIKCGGLAETENLFTGSSARDEVLWMCMLAVYVDQDQEKALKLYRQMAEEGFLGDNGRTFVLALQACSLLVENDKHTDMVTAPSLSMALEIGQALHADAMKRGMLSNVYVGSALIGLYGASGSIGEAENVVNCLSLHDVVVWNTMLLAYIKQNLPERALLLFLHIQTDLNVVPNNRTFVIILQACCMLAEEEEPVLLDSQFIKVKSLEIGEAMHQDIKKLGFIADPFVNNSLICMYGKCGNILEAEFLFGSSCENGDIVAWNIMLSMYTEQGYEEKAFQLLNEMWKMGISQDERTFLISFQACCELAQKEIIATRGERQTPNEMPLELGRSRHSLARRKGLSRRDVVAWNAIIQAYVHISEPERALQIYTEMQRNGFEPSSRTFVVVLEACSMIAEKENENVVQERSLKPTSLEIGHALHMDARKSKFRFDAFVVSALVTMYGKCGSIDEAEEVLTESSPYCGIVAHNAMLSAYIEKGHAEDALRLFKRIRSESFFMDHLTFFYALQACSMIGTLDMCRQIHWMMVSCEYDSGPLLAVPLIQAYGNCASMADAQATFDALKEPDIISWTTLLTSYAQQGNFNGNLKDFREMQFSGIQPDGVAFLSLLRACNHAGITSEGITYFESMQKDYGIDPEIEHFSVMIDILGRAGDFENVKEMLAKMPMNPDSTTWLCLLSACRHHGQFQLGKETFESAMHLYPMLESSYVLMGNMYADHGL